MGGRITRRSTIETSLVQKGLSPATARRPCPGITLGRMLLGFLIYAQAAAGQPVYATERVRELVSRAAAANQAPPLSLAGYSARVESEFSLILRDS